MLLSSWRRHTGSQAAHSLIRHAACLAHHAVSPPLVPLSPSFPLAQASLSRWYPDLPLLPPGAAARVATTPLPPGPRLFTTVCDALDVAGAPIVLIGDVRVAMLLCWLFCLYVEPRDPL